jgi:uncharacterized iron-regulated membrane protein
MRTVHRVISLFVVLVTLYLGVTGTVIQGVDLRSIYRHAPATDPDMMAMREDHDGPGVYAVIGTADYTTAVLPAQFNYQAALPKLMIAARAALGPSPLDYAEFRMNENAPVGKVLSGNQLFTYQFTNDQSQLGPPPPRADERQTSTRNRFKSLHRMTTFNEDWMLFINPIVGISMGAFVVTGLWMYFQLLSARSRIRRRNWFWKSGGWWRTLHRWTSLVAAVFLMVVALSGTWLAYESLVFGYYMTAHRPVPGKPRPPQVSPFAPLNDGQLPAMLTTSLNSWRTSLADQPLKVLRLRIYGGMPQGVVVVGQGDDTQQVVFNATTGREASETEPGYPETGFPFGWQAHQYAKQIHRGFYLGLTGRWMGLLTGVSMIFLSISGAWMYWNMWIKRRRSGRNALLWK